ncbi:MAG: hypothetical protein ABI273_08190 [Lacunisphaera sp.]
MAPQRHPITPIPIETRLTCVTSSGLAFAEIKRPIIRTTVEQNLLPLNLLDGAVRDYDDLLEQPRRLMTAKLKTYFQIL